VRAADAQGTPTQSHVSPSILVYEEYRLAQLNPAPPHATGAGSGSWLRPTLAGASASPERGASDTWGRGAASLPPRDGTAAAGVMRYAGGRLGSMRRAGMVPTGTCRMRGVLEALGLVTCCREGGRGGAGGKTLNPKP